MDAIVLEESYRRTLTVPGHQPVDLLRVATASAVTAMSFLIVMLVVEAAAAGPPHTGLAGEPVAEATAEAEAMRTTTSLVSHVVATMPAKKLKKFNVKSPPRQATTTASPPSTLGFAICFSRRNSNIWGSPSMAQSKIQSSGSDATPFIENAGGNNDTKCLYFPFCLDQAPLTWLESLEKYSIDKWDQLKDQFTATSRVLWVAWVLAWTWQW
jgi:hypothetical protein